MRYEAQITKNTSMVFFFVASVLILIAIFMVAGKYQLTLIDEVSSPDQVRDLIQKMSDQQKIIHAWVTATLDVLFPLAYGALFIGASLKFYPKVGKYFVIIVCISVISDFVEGVVQILALTNTLDILEVKMVATPVKTWTFLLGCGVSVVGILKALYESIRSRFKS